MHAFAQKARIEHAENPLQNPINPSDSHISFDHEINTFIWNFIMSWIFNYSNRLGLKLCFYNILRIRKKANKIILLFLQIKTKKNDLNQLHCILQALQRSFLQENTLQIGQHFKMFIKSWVESGAEYGEIT